MNITLDTKDFDLKFPLLVEKQKFALKQAILKTGMKVASNAKRTAPVRTGTLRGTINNKPDLKNYRTVVTSGVHYDVYNEVRKPFFGPALQMEKQNFIQDIKSAIR